MDNLLRQLRHSMAELSIQGEDFARQMWQMYAIFEEFLNNHLGWNHSVTSEEMARHQADGYPRFSCETVELSNDDSPATKMPSSATEEPCNPLLETIRIIQSLDDAEFECSTSEEKPEEKRTAVDGDKDSVGYAGSNSVDSGYKSSCPTPDLSDGSCYGGDGSSLNRSLECKPRIAMGTRVMHRQHQYLHRYACPDRNSSGARCDVSPDHLTTLQRTLVSAMRQCRNDAGAPEEGIDKTDCSRPKAKTPKLGTQHRMADHFLQCAAFESRSRRMPSPTLGSRQLRTPSPGSQRPRRVSSPSLSSWQRPRNRTTDDEFDGTRSFRPYGSARSEPSVVDEYEPKPFAATRCSDGRSSRSHCLKTIRFNVNGTEREPGANVVKSWTKCKSKPILKDPICANLRAQLEDGDSNVPMLEEEIDALLYGKTDGCGAKRSDGIPCSYVTMIEDKYRRSSVARVKKLRDRVSDADARPGTTIGNDVRADDDLSLDEPLRMSSDKEPTAVDPSDMKLRFSEVACCMLEIIEDLQRQKLLSNPTEAEESASRPAKCEETPSEANYHVYEEILYDPGRRRGAPGEKTNTPAVPPPLPKRPDNGPRATVDASRPKQRLNLYSLFQERSDRRSIAVSLEREWQRESDDEYGFDRTSNGKKLF